jgi:nucleoside-diphosphate kinase
MIEQTLIFFKPDAVKRNMVGKILTVFQNAELKIVAMKSMMADKERLAKHYHKEDAWLERVGGFVKKDYEALGMSAKEALGTDIPKELGQKVIEQLIDYMSKDMVIGMVLQGNNAVSKVRNLVGATYPDEADPGSIRGKFSSDSKDLAAIEKRAVENLVHASGEKDEAEFEIGLWFPELKK